MRNGFLRNRWLAPSEGNKKKKKKKKKEKKKNVLITGARYLGES